MAAGRPLPHFLLLRQQVGLQHLKVPQDFLHQRLSPWARGCAAAQGKGHLLQVTYPLRSKAVRIRCMLHLVPESARLAWLSSWCHVRLSFLTSDPRCQMQKQQSLASSFSSSHKSRSHPRTKSLVLPHSRRCSLLD